MSNSSTGVSHKMFREHEGFTVQRDAGTKRPKGVARKGKMSATRGFIRGDRISLTEDAIWLNPRYRTQTTKEIRQQLRG